MHALRAGRAASARGHRDALRARAPRAREARSAGFMSARIETEMIVVPTRAFRSAWRARRRTSFAASSAASSSPYPSPLSTRAEITLTALVDGHLDAHDPLDLRLSRLLRVHGLDADLTLRPHHGLRARVGAGRRELLHDLLSHGLRRPQRRRGRAPARPRPAAGMATPSPPLRRCPAPGRRGPRSRRRSPASRRGRRGLRRIGGRLRLRLRAWRRRRRFGLLLAAAEAEAAAASGGSFFFLMSASSIATASARSRLREEHRPRGEAPAWRTTLPPIIHDRTDRRPFASLGLHVDGELGDSLLLREVDHVDDPAVQRPAVGAHDEARLAGRVARLLEDVRRAPRRPRPAPG